MNNNKFRKIFRELRNRRRKIVDLSEDIIDSIQQSVDKYHVKDEEAAFYVVTFCAILLFATAPFIISYYYNYLLNITPIIKGYLSQKNYLDTHLFIHISFFFVFISIPIYTVFMPSKKTFFGTINKGLKYFVYTISFHYFALLIPMTYITSYELFPSWLVNYVIITWLMIPGLFLSVCPAILITIILALLSRNNNKNKKILDLIPGVIVNKLVCLLNDIDLSDFTGLRSNNITKKLNTQISEISHLINDMKLSFIGSNSVNQNIFKKFEVAAYAFYSLKICVSLPESSSKQLLTQKVVSILNIFLTGNYRNLPDYPYVNYTYSKQTKRVSLIRSMLSLLTLGIFLATPVIFWGLMLWFFKPPIDASIHTLLVILYTIWCIVGILSYSDKLAPDAKSLIIDTVKLILSKK